MVKIIDCPRDAMQGIKTFIPTAKKIEYINQLLKVGFDSLDFGSFVSSRAIPQLKDTAKVVDALNMDDTKTKLLAIIANERGARDASEFAQITYLGYPFSISETFQKKNTHAGLKESLIRLEKIINIAERKNKEVVVHIAMGFGNPYNDIWNLDILSKYVYRLVTMGIDTIIISDTVGLSKKNVISQVFNYLIPQYPDIEFGAHFHSDPDSWYEKIDAAFKAGCRRFDGALKGFGGCPMSGYGLVGNMPTENIIFYMNKIREDTGLDEKELNIAKEMAIDFFPAN
jgi:hydroxymethylglutaryl-CoA lyase